MMALRIGERRELGLQSEAGQEHIIRHQGWFENAVSRSGPDDANRTEYSQRSQGRLSIPHRMYKIVAKNNPHVYLHVLQIKGTP